MPKIMHTVNLHMAGGIGLVASGKGVDVEKSDGASPVVQRRRLRSELRRIRGEAGETQEQVALAMDWSLSKLIRIENGTVGISTNDLKVLLSHYGIIDDDRIEEFIALARAAKERSWWSMYSDVAESKLLQFVEYEAAAKVTRSFEPLLIPGLLQTEEYAREVIGELRRPMPKKRLDALVELRMRRQDVLKQDGPPPWFFFILDESVVLRSVGGKGVMSGQIHRLIELASRDNVTIEIVPFSAGINRGMHGPFEVFELPGTEDEDVLYLESPRGDLLNRGDDLEEINTYRDIFEELRKKSLGIENSLKFLREQLDKL